MTQYNPQMLLDAATEFLEAHDVYMQRCIDTRHEARSETLPVLKKLYEKMETKEERMRKIARWANKHKSEWLDNAVINIDKEYE